MKNLTQKELLAKIKALGAISNDQRNKVTCVLVGHSSIQTQCLGYFNCGRCGAQMGDNLAGAYEAASKVVIVGHACDTCKANYAKTDWRDRLYAPDPFAVEQA